MASNTHDLGDATAALDLNNIRKTLMRMEDSIVFSLIERSLPLWTNKVDAYREDLAERRRRDEATLSSAFWLAVYENDGQSREDLEGYFLANEKGPVRNFADATESDTDKFARWHRGMLEEGVYLAPSQYEAGFTGLKHTEEDIDFTIEAAKRVMARI